MDDDVRAKTGSTPSSPLVDAKHLPLRLKDSREAEDQIAFADVVAAQQDRPRHRRTSSPRSRRSIRAINPYAEIHRTQRSGDRPRPRARPRRLRPGAGAAKTTRISSSRRRPVRPRSRSRPRRSSTTTAITSTTIIDHHDHHHRRQAFADPRRDGRSRSRCAAARSNPESSSPGSRRSPRREGPNILRLKGIIAFKDDAERYVVQGVHMIVEGDHQRPWKDGEKRESRLVFIGRELDREKLEALLQGVRGRRLMPTVSAARVRSLATAISWPSNFLGAHCPLRFARPRVTAPLSANTGCSHGGDSVHRLDNGHKTSRA